MRYYLIMRLHSQSVQWLDADTDTWHFDRTKATRFYRIHDSILPLNGKWVGPIDDEQDGTP